MYTLRGLLQLKKRHMTDKEKRVLEEDEFYFQEFRYKSPEENAQKWQKLLLYVLRQANIVDFVIKNTKSLPPSLEPFLPNLIKIFSTRWRWGAKQISSTAYARFTISEELKNFIFSRRYIGHWGLEYPEDPAFYKDDMLILWVIGHENMVFVRLSDEEATEFNKEGFSLEKIRTRLPYPVDPLE